MTTLHVISHSPFTDSRLTSCLRVLGVDDAILLCGDATYALVASTAARLGLESKAEALNLYALDEDVKARHVTLPDWAKSIDYPGFVELSIRFNKVNTWL